MSSEGAVILSQPFAGLQAQALGLAARAGLDPVLRPLVARRPWRWLPARTWPAPLAAVGGLSDLPPSLVLSVGGMGGAVASALRARGHRVVQIQNPRMRLDRFDLVVANPHDAISGANVLISRNALHRVGPMLLAEAAARWAPAFAHLPRPLVAVLVGGSNGRFRLEAEEGEALATLLATTMRADRAGLMLTSSRRTAPAARAAFERKLAPLGAWLWDMQGDNPYLGMLACADHIVVTTDSVSMISEAVATAVPVHVASLPGGSRRIGLFVETMRQAGRVRDFHGRLESWPVRPLDDTPQVADEMRRRLGWTA